MDLSKLPKLSQTPPPPPPDLLSTGGAAAGDATQPRPVARGSYCPSCAAPVPIGQRFCGTCGADTHARPSTGDSEPRGEGTPAAVMQAWFFGIVGALLLFVGGTYASYTIAHLRHQPYHTNVNWTDGPLIGQEVEYPDLIGHPLWTDSGVFFFGLSLILSAVAEMTAAMRLRIARAVVLLSLLAVLAATIYNLYVSGMLLKANVTPLLTGLFSAFGGYVVFEQWMLLTSTGRKPAA